MHDAPSKSDHTVNNNDNNPPNIVHNDVQLKNGALNGHSDIHQVVSPAADSPVTPVSHEAAPLVKIDVDYQEQESDARHEPLPVKMDSIDNASTMPQVGTPIDPASIPVDPPNGTPTLIPGELLEDVQMAESSPNGIEHVEDNPDIRMTTPSTNGHVNGDVNMNDPTPATTPAADVPGTSSTSTIETNHVSTARTSPDDSTPKGEQEDDDRPPPAKRARKHSNADQASLAHSATPPPASAESIQTNGSTPIPHSPGQSTLSPAQFRLCQSTIRQLRKLKDAIPFLTPVDPVVLNIPHYPTIIKSPMDFSTIERKLTSSNPTKPDNNSQNPRYLSADEFIADVRLIFSNCVTFNGPDHIVTAMGKRVEAVFDKSIKHMPAAIESKPVVKKIATPPPPPPPVAVPAKKAQPVRRASTSVPVIRRSDADGQIGRPKREIHPPPPKDLPYADAPKKQRKGKRVKDDGTNEQLKFCAKVLSDIHRKQHWGIANPFYEPVDWVALELPTYPKVVKKPMDLSTMRKKLENREYPTAQKFYDDFKLMIRNCFLFNPAGTPVNQAGIELQRLFDDKWKNLPPLHEVSDDDDEDDEWDSEEETPFAGTIAMMESQIETMRGSIAALKGAKVPKEKKKKEKREKGAPVASSSKSAQKPGKQVSSKKKGKKPVADDDVLTFEQKKDLSEAIGKLDGTKLERVIQIIHEGVPEIRDSTEEIELEIDQLPAIVLTKLYNFVLRPLRTGTTKRNRTGKGTGTGGLKRKSMDEDVEAEKIRQLEERMRLFDQGSAGAAGAPPRREDDSEHSSDSSSGSDSSGSDSE